MHSHPLVFWGFKFYKFSSIFVNKFYMSSFLVVILCLTGCSFGGSKGILGDLTTQVNELQKDKQVLLYAPQEMKQAEDSLIQAVNSWNAGKRDVALQYAKVTEEKIALTKEVTRREAALGLDDVAWSQRNWLIEVRNKRLAQ